MDDPASADQRAEDEAALARHGEVLASACEAALPRWVERVVRERAEAWRPGLGDELAPAAAAAGLDALAAIGPQLRALLASDPDRQPTGPLAVLRGAVSFPTRVLEDAGVPDVVRDDFAERAFPADRYDLAPASFADLDPSVHEPGLVWGAAKAHVVLARRRAT